MGRARPLRNRVHPRARACRDEPGASHDPDTRRGNPGGHERPCGCSGHPGAGRSARPEGHFFFDRCGIRAERSAAIHRSGLASIDRHAVHGSGANRSSGASTDRHAVHGSGRPSTCGSTINGSGGASTDGHAIRGPSADRSCCTSTDRCATDRSRSSHRFRPTPHRSSGCSRTGPADDPARLATRPPRSAGPVRPGSAAGSSGQRRAHGSPGGQSLFSAIREGPWARVGSSRCV